MYACTKLMWTNFKDYAMLTYMYMSTVDQEISPSINFRWDLKNKMRNIFYMESLYNYICTVAVKEYFTP